MLIILGLGRLRPKGGKLEASLGYGVRPCNKTKQISIERNLIESNATGDRKKRVKCQRLPKRLEQERTTS